MTRPVDLIRREILARDLTLIGTVVGAKRPAQFDGTAPTSGVMWVVNVDIGSNRVLFSVPVKAGANGDRFYADLGQTVQLRKNQLGRWQVIGPGDRAAALGNVTTWNPVTQDEISSLPQGFQQVRDPWSYYGGDVYMVDNPDVTFSAAGTIVRSAGSFVTDGFEIGQTVQVQRSLNAQNDGQFLVTGVVTATLSVSGVVVNEGPTSGVAIAEAGQVRWNDGISTLPSYRLLNAQGQEVDPSA